MNMIRRRGQQLACILKLQTSILAPKLVADEEGCNVVATRLDMSTMYTHMKSHTAQHCGPSDALAARSQTQQQQLTRCRSNAKFFAAAGRFWEVIGKQREVKRGAQKEQNKRVSTGGSWREKEKRGLRARQFEHREICIQKE
jgi:hypothetical protein